MNHTRVRVALLPSDLKYLEHDAQEVERRKPSVAIVIDTLRFTTTATQALAQGAKEIRVGSEIDEVKAQASQLPENTYLLCGERHCRPIPDFDLGNSPHEYSRAKVGDRTLFFTTTNGTRAIAAASGFDEVWLGSLVNRASVVDKLSGSQAKDVYLICSGTDGVVAAEDVLAAGAILQRMSVSFPTKHLGDGALIALNLWQSVVMHASLACDTRAELVNFFNQAAGGSNLLEAGYQQDIEFAAALDSLGVVPRSTDEFRNFKHLR